MILDAVVRAYETAKQTKGDSHLKSVMKSLTWRILGTLDTMLISYLITGELFVAFTIGSVEVITKMILYYVHERLWEKISFAKK